MSDFDLRENSKKLALKVINCFNINNLTVAGKVIANQIIRSATSIGANIFEAHYAASKADFINKLQISLKECYETEYWLDLAEAVPVADGQKLKEIKHDCGEIRRVLISSITTAKNNT